MPPLIVALLSLFRSDQLLMNMTENPKLMQTINGVAAGTSDQERSSLSADDQDTEISIFDAQRYFNETNNDSRVCKRVSPLHDPIGARFSSASSAADGYGYGGRTFRARSFHATPTASSEASWNSQTGLLSHPPGAIPVSMTMKTSINTTDDHKRKGSGKMKWLWGRRCPCSGKKSVQVEPKTPSGSGTNPKSLNHKREEILLACNPHRISAENQFHNSSIAQRVVSSSSAKARTLMINDCISGTESITAGFTFPILNQQPTTSSSSHLNMAAAVNRNYTSIDDQDQDPSRDSLEVFQPKKLVSRSTVTDDDVGSDTSSDLFEIESFSTATQTLATPNQPYHRRDSLDEASNFNIRRSINGCTSSCLSCPYSPMTNECYEPSEVSIDWSVTTAEAFERGSVGASEAEETKMMPPVAVGKKKPESGGGGLLSCRCEKAVSVVVGPNPVKCVSPQGQAANASKHVGNVNKQPPLARLSIPFAA